MYRRNDDSLRKLFANSAWFAAFVGAISMLFSAYAYIQFPEKISLKERVNFIRNEISPRTLVLMNFAKDSAVAQSVNKPWQEPEFRFLTPSNEEIARVINDFVTPLNSKGIDSEKINAWLNDNSLLGIKWSPLIDDAKANNENNVNLLIRALLIDYSNRLSHLLPSFKLADRDLSSKISLNVLFSPSGYNDMPNFIAWFATNLNREFASLALEAQEKEKVALTLSKWMRPSFEAALLEFAYAITALLFLRAPWQVFLVAMVLLAIVGSSLAAAWSLKKSAIGIGELILAFSALVFAANLGLFSVSVGRRKANILKKKFIFDAFIPILLIIFLISFVNANISIYLFFGTLILYAAAIGYLLFLVRSSETKGSSRRDERLRSEWKGKLRKIAKELPSNDSYKIALSLIDHVDSSTTNFIQAKANEEISEKLDALLTILSQPTHNPFVVKSKLLGLKELLIEAMN